MTTTKKKKAKATTTRKAKKSLPDRGKFTMRESRGLNQQIDDAANALGVTKNALYTLGMTGLLARLAPVLKMEMNVDDLKEILKSEFNDAIRSA